MAKGIRSYGAGKFYDIIDSYAYELTLEGGADEEVSFGDGGEWYGLMKIDQSFADAIHKVASEANDQLTDEEQDLLDESKAVILFSRSDGIVEATWYDNLKESEKDWEKIEAEADEIEGDEEEDDEGEEEEEGDDVFSDEEMVSGYVISDSRQGGYEVAHEHKHVGHYDDMAEALEAIEAAMKSGNYYPNVYYVNDHGNVDLLDASGNTIESRV